MRIALPVKLTDEEWDWLQKTARSGDDDAALGATLPHRLARCGGEEQSADRDGVGYSEAKVGLWRKRSAQAGRAGIEHDASGLGRKQTYPRAVRQLLIQKTTGATPPEATHWSRTSMAKAMELSPSTVGRIWRAHGLKPHLLRTFKVSSDPHFAEKLDDIIGLYLHTPKHAVVLCCDEKSQVQSLDRTQPKLPLKRGRAGTMTHDYVRHGTTTLFAALKVADGQVIAQCQGRHRHQEWLRFLQQLHRETPAERDLHLILDNYATHKHPKSKRGWPDIPAFISTLLPRAPPGSTW